MECVVCAESLNTSPGACIPCGHVFHLDCLGTWLTDHKNCPMCREQYDLTDMQMLFLPENEDNEKNKEIRKKWEAYTNLNKKHKLNEQRITTDDEFVARNQQIIYNFMEATAPPSYRQEENTARNTSQCYQSTVSVEHNPTGCINLENDFDDDCDGCCKVNGLTTKLIQITVAFCIFILIILFMVGSRI